MKSSAGLQTRIGPSCETDLVVNRITWHLNRMVKWECSANEKLIRWRLVIRAAQDEYDRELQQLDSLNVPMADPATEVEIPG